MVNSKTSPIACVLIDGEKIRDIRQERGLTQLYVATSLEITTDTVSRWENKRSPSIKLENAEKLAEVLEVDLADITQAPTDMEQNALPADCGDEAEPSTPPAISPRGLWVMPLVMIVLVFGWLWFRHNGGVTVPPAVSGERLLPKHGSPHLPFPVLIRVHADNAAVTSFILREALPDTCTVANGIPAFTAQDSSGVKWIHTTGAEDLYFGYLVTPSAEVRTGDELGFNGVLLVDNRKQIVQGAATITMVDYHWADRNNDYQIDDNEILAIYSSFEIFKEMGVDIDTIQQIWAGKGYRWDADQKEFQVVSGATVSGGD